ncbi:MAG TPA: ShlB/FhaC/HecB family hemolysin secretion/activation protein [Myxococcota bacterium]|nr:ShlB/FhaC/HecB family hemolysin secretion/activation protein [Myxococcota bacterium]
MNISVLRVSQEYLHRGQNHVLALRSSFNVGLDAFESTDDRVTGDPNGRFVSWLGQGQYVHRLFQTQNEVLLRVTGQWTPDPLLALEQLSVGGYGSVRGYPENQLVRDRGAVSSLEFHLPIAYNRSGAPMVQLAPFFDYGAAWNLRASPSPTTLYSAGSGLLVNVTRHVAAQLYWGYRLRHVTLPDSLGAQGLGLSFRVTLQAF